METLMSIKRRQHSSKFKSQVVIAAIKGDKTIAQLSKEFNINQSRITAWKKIAYEGMSSLFDIKARTVVSYSEHEIEKLYAQIGKLQVERDYLKKTCFNQL